MRSGHIAHQHRRQAKLAQRVNLCHGPQVQQNHGANLFARHRVALRAQVLANGTPQADAMQQDIDQRVPELRSRAVTSGWRQGAL